MIHTDFSFDADTLHRRGREERQHDGERAEKVSWKGKQN